MEIVNSLKSRIGSEEEKQIATLLGESVEAIDKSLDLSLNAMLGGLKKITEKESSAASIQKVINDGGHSGDIIDDLSGLFNNSDKTKLLITIGENINNHFFKPYIEALVSRISALGSISKSSALSLFSLSAPLVLGALGKNIRIGNLSTSEFTASLEKEKLLIDEAVSTSLMRTLGFETQTEVVSSEALISESEQYRREETATPIEATVERKTKSKEKRKSRGKSESDLNWLAWLLLGLLGICALYYGLEERFTENALSVQPVVNLDSTAYENKGNIFDDLNTDRNRSMTYNEEGGIAPDSSNSENDNSSNANAENTLRNSSSEVINNSNTQRATANQNVSRDTRSMASKLRSNGRFFGVNDLTFRRNSAELSNQGSISQLIDYLLDNPSTTVQLAGTGSSRRLAEDRAYSLRGVLFEKGIDASRLTVSESSVSGDCPVMLKIQ